MLAEEQAVVREEDEHGLAELIEALELVVEPAHRAVRLLQGREAAATAPRPPVDLLLRQRRLRSQEGRLVAHVRLVERGRAGQLRVLELPLVAGSGHRAVQAARALAPPAGMGRELVELQIERLAAGHEAAN
jgi:hypothetical protein